MTIVIIKTLTSAIMADIFTLKNLQTEAHIELKTANREWSDCVTNNFMPQWLKGDKINVQDVCGS